MNFSPGSTGRWTASSNSPKVFRARDKASSCARAKTSSDFHTVKIQTIVGAGTDCILQNLQL